MALQLSQKRVFDSPAIPDRLYFKIGDVARICEVQTYVLRFWETQFPQLKPNKSGTGQRLYRRRDVELALKIKQLVHAEGYTLAGARQVLEDTRGRPNLQPDSPTDPQPLLPLLVANAATPLSAHSQEAVATTIAHARAELREIVRLLTSPDPQPTTRRRSGPTTIPSTSDSLFPL
jgi:DNA-binding transcriptional MerR regulator